MRHSDFSRLSALRQVDLLYRHAVYISKRKDARTIKVLYQLDGFYVEISYRKYRWHIDRIQAFESMDRLDPYLQFVDVEELMNC